MFTGDVRKKPDSDENEDTWSFEKIRQHRHNFVVSTLDGVDSEETGIRPSSEESSEYHIYKGHQNGDLPTSYTIGDHATYAKNLGDVDVNMISPLNLDVEYPQSERQKDDPTKKWIRHIQQVVMNRQIIPLYTSMETMTDDVHDVTVEQLKGITFQVIPQLYWRYEWTFNDLMIHRVGKLQSPSQEIEMYDMLGNVWEWVRDDWDESDNPISKLNGKVNPIVGT